MDFLNDDIVLRFHVIIEESMIVFEFDVFAEESQLIPKYTIVEVVFGQVFFQLIDSDPWKILASEGGTFFLSFRNLVFKCQKDGLSLSPIRH